MTRLNSQMTQTQWIAFLEERLAQSPKNMGIKFHLRDVRKMSAEQFDAHKAKTLKADPARDAEIARMARNIR